MLSALVEATDEGEGLSWAEATAVIASANEASDDRFWDEKPAHFEAEVEGILEDLTNRGYLYEAESELRVTDRDVLE